ncbi:hypothetical protein [Salinimicrobium flavum]|uniref:hypothetical protein n=1 Tax=Salinimicrobium flavum TaxID=1737065 RepID=UPI0036D2B279
MDTAAAIKSDILKSIGKILSHPAVSWRIFFFELFPEIVKKPFAPLGFPLATYAGI